MVRDPRLIDFDAGRWEGQAHHDIGASAEYQRFLVNPVDESIPGGENISDVRDRIVASVSQALADNELGANILIVSHAGPLRVAARALPRNEPGSLSSVAALAGVDVDPALRVRSRRAAHPHH